MEGLVVLGSEQRPLDGRACISGARALSDLRRRPSGRGSLGSSREHKAWMRAERTAIVELGTLTDRDIVDSGQKDRGAGELASRDVLLGGGL